MKTYEQLQPYQQRVVEELEALTDKVLKLEGFIESDAFNKLSVPAAYLLLQQDLAMIMYMNALTERIKLFREE